MPAANIAGNFLAAIRADDFGSGALGTNRGSSSASGMRPRFPRPGGGKEYFGGIGERAFLCRLDPHTELRVQLPWATREGIAEYEFRRVDDTGLIRSTSKCPCT
jgi:hypothetical protein